MLSGISGYILSAATVYSPKYMGRSTPRAHNPRQNALQQYNICVRHTRLTASKMMRAPIKDSLIKKYNYVINSLRSTERVILIPKTN